jgi:alcohol dehydrogenase class IV
MLPANSDFLLVEYEDFSPEDQKEESVGKTIWYEDPAVRSKLSSGGGAAFVRGVSSSFRTPFTVFGSGATRQLRWILPQYTKGKRILILTDKVFEKKGTDQIKNALDKKGYTIETWSKTLPDPPIQNAQEGAAFAQEFKPDILIGIGGGSVLDIGKAIWVLYESPHLDFFDINPSTQIGLRAKTHYVAIPTTSGTGSEATNVAVLTDTSVNPHKKITVLAPEILPDIAILDPTLTATMPSKLTAGTGMDALAHAVGAYLSHWSNEYTDSLAERAIRFVFEYLPRAYQYPYDMEARRKMLIASNMASLAMANGASGLEHGLGHALGAILRMHHGVAVSVFLPYTIQFASKISDKYLGIAKILGCEGNNNPLDCLIKKFKEFGSMMGVPSRIKEFVKEEEFIAQMDNLINYTMADLSSVLSPRPIDRKLVRKIFESVFSGQDIDF